MDFLQYASDSDEISVEAQSLASDNSNNDKSKNNTNENTENTDSGKNKVQPVHISVTSVLVKHSVNTSESTTANNDNKPGKLLQPTAIKGIPDAPDISPNAETKKKISMHLQAKHLHGTSLSDNIRQHKSFGNPSMLQKIVDHFNIDQYGSNIENMRGHSTDTNSVSNQ